MNKTKINLLRRLEWSKTYSYCTGWPCCPICNGTKPGHGLDERGAQPVNTGHQDGCELAAALNVIANRLAPERNNFTRAELRLFVWTGFCRSWTPGLAFAIAKDETDARKQIEKELGYTVDSWGDLNIYPLTKRIARSVVGGG